MILIATLVTPLAAGLLFGRGAARRAFTVVAAGLALALLVSAYWIVPSGIQLLDSGYAQFVPASSWTWTEGRATILNGLWLNNFWEWAYPEYSPFASRYDTFPLFLLRFAPAILAFSTLTLKREWVDVVNGTA